jgi:hypothetical protein
LGKVGSLIAKLLGEEPEKQVYDELRAFKQLMEIGEVTISDGSLFGPHLAQRPGQPPSDEELAKRYWRSLDATSSPSQGNFTGEAAGASA